MSREAWGVQQTSVDSVHRRVVLVTGAPAVMA